MQTGAEMREEFSAEGTLYTKEAGHSPAVHGEKPEAARVAQVT